MYSHLVSVVALVAFAIDQSTAQTPPGFSPKSSNPLIVNYGGSAVSPPGVTVPVAEVASPPSLSLPTSNAVSGNSDTYAVVMLDLSVETTTPPNPAGPNTTLLHWIQPNLTPTLQVPTSASCAQNASSSSLSLVNISNTGPIAPYFPPGPPPNQTHTYTLLLFAQSKQFKVPEDYVPYFENITASANNRIGFNLTKFAGESGLGELIAAEWFLASNFSSAGTNSSGPSSSSGSGSSSSSGATASSTTGTSGASVTGGAAASGSSSSSSGLSSASSSASATSASSSSAAFSSSDSVAIEVSTALIVALGGAGIWLFNVL